MIIANVDKQNLLFSSEIKVPVAILAAEIDNSYTPEKTKQIGEMLSAKAEVRTPGGIFCCFS